MSRDAIENPTPAWVGKLTGWVAVAAVVLSMYLLAVEKKEQHNKALFWKGMYERHMEVEHGL